MGNNSTIAGDAWSGGYDPSDYGISMSGGARVLGNAKASSSTPDCADDPSNTKYKIGTSGTVSGAATAWGTITSTVTGTTLPNTCTAAPATKTIPTYTFNAANYPAATLHTYTFPADYAAFNTYIAANKNNLSGTFYITGGGSAYPVSLDGTTVTGDLTVIATDSPIDMTTGGMERKRLHRQGRRPRLVVRGTGLGLHHDRREPGRLRGRVQEQLRHGLRAACPATTTPRC